MIILDDLKAEMVGYRKEIEELSDVLNIKQTKKELAELNEAAAKDGFWDDLENSQKVLQQTKAADKQRTAAAWQNVRKTLTLHQTPNTQTL